MAIKIHLNQLQTIETKNRKSLKGEGAAEELTAANKKSALSFYNLSKIKETRAKRISDIYKNNWNPYVVWQILIV